MNQEEYEESFFYDKPSDVGSEVAGEAIGLGLGLGVGLIGTILSGLLFLLTRIDLLSSGLLGLLFFMLTYKNEWDTIVYLVAVAVIIIGSVLLQKFLKPFRIIYALFACVFASIFGPIFIGYDTDLRLYSLMAICFGVMAVLSFFSWKSRW